MTDAAETVLRDGRTHWRLETAARLVFPLDGAAYVAALPAACIDERHTIRVVGRDIHSRLAATPATALACAALVAVRRHTPLAEFVTLPYLVGEAHALSDRPWLPVHVLRTFIFGGFLMVPVTSLIVLAAPGYALRRRRGVDEEQQ